MFLWCTVYTYYVCMYGCPDVSGVFAVATSAASEINSLLSEMLNGNDRLTDIVNDKPGQSYRV